jgi:hypothetical protein
LRAFVYGRKYLRNMKVIYPGEAAELEATYHELAPDVNRTVGPVAQIVLTRPVKCKICYAVMQPGEDLVKHFRAHGGPPEAKAMYGCDHGTLYVDVWFGRGRIVVGGSYVRGYCVATVDWPVETMPDVLRRVVVGENAGRLDLSGRWWPRTWRSAMGLEALYHELAAGPS